jgi:hypothetical protein
MAAPVSAPSISPEQSAIPTSLKAAAHATGALLIAPYLFVYDMMVLAIPVGSLVRPGLRTGFRKYELPALASPDTADAGLSARYSMQ